MDTRDGLVDNWLNDCEYFLIVVWPMTNVVHMVLLASEICCIIPVTLQCLLIVRQIVARCLITGQRLSWIKPQTCSWNVVITISWRTIVFWSMPWTFLLWSTNMTKYFLLPMSKCVKLASRSLGLWIIHPSHDLSVSINMTSLHPRPVSNEQAWQCSTKRTLRWNSRS